MSLEITVSQAASDWCSEAAVNPRGTSTYSRNTAEKNKLFYSINKKEKPYSEEVISAAYETPFTVSVDLNGHGCTTGISASDRSKTIQALIDPSIHPSELGKPGHIFPLRAKKEGVLRGAGHTEAAVDLSRVSP